MLVRNINTPFGHLILIASGRNLVYCNWDHPDSLYKLEKTRKLYDSEGTLEEEKVLNETERQLESYLAGELQVFDIPLGLDGTPFSELVWQEIAKIPYGETISYKRLAELVAKPGAFRAVASACGKNPIAVIIPCHRVVSENGLGGYTGGLEKKIRLLAMEKDAVS